MHDAPIDSTKSIKEGYEVTDISARLVFTSLVALAILTVGALFAIIILIRGIEGGVLGAKEAHPRAENRATGYDGPRLQQDPVGERRAIIGAAEAHLQSFGIVNEDPAMRRAHIPIEKAMALVAEGAVPYRQTPVAATIGNPPVPAAQAEPQSAQ